MESIMNYVRPELVVVAFVLYFIGMGLKKAKVVSDRRIPLILGGIGVVICSIYVFSTCTCNGRQEMAAAIFTAVTQGILVAGLSTYVHQIINQSCEEDKAS